MPSITHWGRLEPRCRTDQFDTGLKAQVRDPLWLLARQWQFGEFTGDDAGSPISTGLTFTHNRLDTVHAPDGREAPIGAAELVEAAVEAHGVPLDLRTRTQAGLQFARLLRRSPAAGLLPAFRTAAPLTQTGDGPLTDDPSRRFLAGAAGRVVDGGAILATARRGDSVADLLPPGTGTSAQRDAADDVAGQLVDWFAATYGPEPLDCWEPARLQHRFTATAEGIPTKPMVVAPEYRGGRLDWFDADLAAPPVSQDPTTVEIVPTSVTFAGMPSSRWWEFEDGRTDFGAIEPNTTDVAALLLADFALIYADDWLLAPLQVPSGALVTMVDLVVTDTFGERTRIRPAGSGFAMFRLSTAPGSDLAARGDVLLTAPTASASASIDGRPTEEVTLFRDEMANLAWGVEDVLGSDLAEPASGFDAHRQGLLANTPAPGSADLHYRLMTDVAANWLPFQAVRDPARPRSRALELTPFLREAGDGTLVPVEPRGALLRAAAPYRLDEEALPRSARSLTIAFQRARTVDGGTRLWRSRRTRPKRPQAGSGLEFDQLSAEG